MVNNTVNIRTNVFIVYHVLKTEMILLSHVIQSSN